MKKQIFLGAALLSLFATSCSNDDVIDNANGPVAGQSISLQANIADGPDTRMAYVDDVAKKVLKFSWSDAESFQLYKGTGSTATTFIKTANGNIFTGTIPGGGTDTYYAVYGNNITNYNGVLDVNIANQTGSASAENGITTFMLAQAKYLTQASGMTPTLDFQHKLGVMKLTLTLPDEVTGKVSKITISGLNNKAKYTLRTNTYSNEAKGDITVTNGTTGFTITDNKITAYVAVFPDEVDADQVIIIALVNGVEYHYTIGSKRNLTAGKVTPVTVNMRKALTAADVENAIKNKSLTIDHKLCPSDFDVLNSVFGSGSKYSDISLTLTNQTTLPYQAFGDCPALTSVSLPEATTFGNGAFAGCDKLASVYLPKATTFGYNAFYGCGNLTTISLPEATTFGDYAFSQCSLTSVSLPNATTFGNEAIAGCDKLASVYLPEATTFGNGAFGRCIALTTISLPNATTFGNDAFAGCNKLASVSLPKATTFGYNAFYGCGNLTTISLPEATTFGDYAFFDCVNLTTISLPEATTFGDYAFSQCSLTSVSLPKATTFGDYTFRYCKENSIDLTVKEGATWWDNSSITKYLKSVKNTTGKPLWPSM